MKNYLFFDTETTGLPRNYKAPSSCNQWGRFFVITFFIIGRQAPVPLHKIA